MTKTKSKAGRPQKGLYLPAPNTDLTNRSILYEGKYAVYGLASSDAPDQILYIGVTSTPLFKRYNAHLLSARNNQSPKEQWLNQLLADGKRPVMILLEDGITFYDTARDHEQETINHYTAQGVQLLNRTPGRPCKSLPQAA